MHDDSKPTSKRGIKMPLCPVCEKFRDVANLGDEQWGFCREHGVKWVVGCGSAGGAAWDFRARVGLKWPIETNIFPAGRAENDADHSANRYLLRQFRFPGGAASAPASANEVDKQPRDRRLLVAGNECFVVECPEGPGGTAKLVGGPFQSRRAAELYRDDLDADWSHCNAMQRNSWGVRMVYYRVALVVEFFESEGVPDARRLADRMLALRLLEVPNSEDDLVDYRSCDEFRS